MNEFNQVRLNNIMFIHSVANMDRDIVVQMQKGSSYETLTIQQQNMTFDGLLQSLN